MLLAGKLFKEEYITECTLTEENTEKSYLRIKSGCTMI